jgi:Uma2 family endonuclease
MPGDPVPFPVMVAVHQPPDQAEIHRLRVDEYLVLAELPHWPRTELLEGVIYDMPAESRLHADAVTAVYEKLKVEFATERVRMAGTVEAGEYSMPEPDVYVERAAAAELGGTYTGARSLLLVVEVSLTTLARDEGPKLRTYAAEGVPEYWILVPAGSTSYLLRHTDPVGTNYRTTRRIELPEGVEGLDVAAILGR